MSPRLADVPLFIGGRLRQASSGATYEVINPASGKVCKYAAAATAQDVKEAIESSAVAFDSWRKTLPGAKVSIFKRAATLLASDRYAQKITQAAVEETGSIASWAKIISVDWTLPFLDAVCNMVYKVKGEILVSDVGAKSFVQKLPMGVILIIAPWNAPVLLALMTALPAIAAGNTVVFKTSEHSPGSQLLAAELLKEAGLPDGVFNVIHTKREDSEPRVAEIIAHPAVRKIGFTGSDRVGRILAAEAAKYLKPCVFELGGKAPSVVLADADIDAAARAIISGAFNNSGHMCIGTERVIVQRAVSDQLISRLREIAVKVHSGDQTTTKARLGPVFSAAAAQNIVSMVKEAVDGGAELLVGDLKADGAVVQPHIVLGAKPGQRMWDRESFGPVFTIAVVDTVEEAIKMANASDYSLTSALWTEDMEKAFEVANEIHAGKVIVNGPTYGHEPRFDQQGWGGSSGYGSFAVESFLNTQLVSFQSKDSRKGYLVSDF